MVMAEWLRPLTSTCVPLTAVCSNRTVDVNVYQLRNLYRHTEGLWVDLGSRAYCSEGPTRSIRPSKTVWGRPMTYVHAVGATLSPKRQN